MALVKNVSGRGGFKTQWPQGAIRHFRIDTLASAALTDYIHAQLDRAGLPHSTFTEDATALILRVSEGTLHAVKNRYVGSFIEAVAYHANTVDLKQVNAVLMQPHWRHNSYD